MWLTFGGGERRRGGVGVLRRARRGDGERRLRAGDGLRRRRGGDAALRRSGDRLHSDVPLLPHVQPGHSRQATQGHALRSACSM